MSTVELGDDLGIESSTELKNRLSPLVAEAGELTLDASQVGRIHTASVQVRFVNDQNHHPFVVVLVEQEALQRAELLHLAGFWLHTEAAADLFQKLEG